MPNLTISLTAGQVTRVGQALAFLNDGNAATTLQVQGWLLNQLRNQVSQAERRSSREAADVGVDTTLAAEGW
jgi:hypothetical protein